MDDRETPPYNSSAYHDVLHAIQSATDWNPTTDDVVVDPAGPTEVRFYHPRSDGVLLIQLPDQIDGALARGVLYQPLVGTCEVRSQFRHDLVERYQYIVESYSSPQIRSLSVPPSIAVATFGTNQSRIERRQTATYLECIALDVSHFHDRLYETTLARPDYT